MPENNSACQKHLYTVQFLTGMKTTANWKRREADDGWNSTIHRSGSVSERIPFIMHFAICHSLSRENKNTVFKPREFHVFEIEIPITNQMYF